MSFDMLLAGLKGAGKSTALKAMLQDMVALGHLVMAIDVEGELSGVARMCGGVVVTPSDPASRLNPLELRPMFSKRFDAGADVTDAEADESRRANFVAEMARVQSFFYQYLPSMTDTEADEFLNLLELTCARFGIDGNSRLELLKPTDFPVFSDVLATLRKLLYRDYRADSAQYRDGLTDTRIRTLERLESAVKPLAEGAYSILFNGHSTLDITAESFVVFDISVIGEMGERVYNACLYNILALMWGEIYKNRSRNARITDERDRRYCIAMIDEAHKILNARNTQGLDFIEKLVRRARKYDAALWFASQSPRDFAPEGVGGDLEKLKNIFGMVQYKCLLRQDESDAALLNRLFPQFTETEIQATANFEKGEMILSIGGGRKIRCRRYVPEEDFKYFGGGR
jgi:type IV secretory pathway VirB4 component